MARKKRLDISKAVRRPGALTLKAKRAGMSLYQFAMKNKSKPGLTGQQARFYFTLRSIAKKRK